MKISVVIPCYNYQRYVAAAIECALEQVHSDKEIIVVNDGSTDGSLDIIKRYASSITIIDQVNQGHIVSCNRGYAETTGDIVVFLDADDLLERSALSQVAAAWTSTCSKAQFDLKIIDAEGADTGRRFCNFAAGYGTHEANSAFLRSGTYRWPVTSGNAYARFFLQAMFPLQIKEAPDGLLNTVAPLYGEVIVLPEVLGAYRVHGANIWASTGSDNSRLPHRIHTRQREAAALRERAKQLGKALPLGDVLDHELPMINYRLMSLKLRLPYQHQDRDSIWGLVRKGWRLAAEEPLTFKHRVGHLAWFGLLALMPERAALALIKVRFNRSEIVRSARKAVGLDMHAKTPVHER